MCIRDSSSALQRVVMFLNEASDPIIERIPVSYTHLDVYKRQGLAGEYDRLATFASKGMRQLLRAMAAKAEAVELLRFLRYFSAGHPADFAVSLPAGLLRRSHIPVSYTHLPWDTLLASSLSTKS